MGKPQATTSIHRSAFAKIAGINPSTVTRAIENGYLIPNPDGSLDLTNRDNHEYLFEKWTAQQEKRIEEMLERNFRARYGSPKE